MYFGTARINVVAVLVWCGIAEALPLLISMLQYNSAPFHVRLYQMYVCTVSPSVSEVPCRDQVKFYCLEVQEYLFSSCYEQPGIWSTSEKLSQQLSRLDGSSLSPGNSPLNCVM